MSGDDLHDLERSNPVTTDEVRSRVQLDRTMLTDVFDDVASESSVSRERRTSTVRMLSAAAVTIGALVVPFALRSGDDGPPDMIVPGDPDDAPTDRTDADGPPHSTPDELFEPTTPPTDPDPVRVPPTTTSATAPADDIAVPVTTVPTPVPPLDQAETASEPIATNTSETPTTAAPILELNGPATGAPVGTGDDSGSGGVPTATDAPSTPAPATRGTVAPVPRPDDTPTTTAPVAAPPAPTDPETFTAGRDLLVLTLDFAHLDDAHAAAASRDVSETIGLDPIVIAATADPETGDFVHPYADVLDATWDDRWFDAGTDRAGVIAAATQRWIDAIDGGGTVWVAEGGVSDLTADVLRSVVDARPDLDTSTRVRVIHHSQRNVDDTRPGDIDAITVDATIVRIDDGNTENGTAGLTGASTTFTDAALGGASTARWTAAFDAWPSDSLDFSDVVTMLHVVEIGLDEVATVDDFAARFVR